MSVDIEQVYSDVAQAEIRVQSHLFAVSYKPNLITPRYLEKVQQSNDITTFCKMFCELVVDWDVMRAGEKFPLDPDTLQDIPVAFLRGIIDGIIDNTTGSEKA